MPSSRLSLAARLAPRQVEKRQKPSTAAADVKAASEVQMELYVGVGEDEEHGMGEVRAWEPAARERASAERIGRMERMERVAWVAWEPAAR